MQLKITRIEINNMISDITRILTQLMIVHFLTYIIDNDGKLFDDKTLRHMLCMCVGIILFHIFTRNISYIKKKLKK